MTYITREAAATLGISVRRVQQACRRDGLGEKRGRDHLLTEADMEYLRSRLGKRGRPAAPSPSARTARPPDTGDRR